ncbi:MAG: hypothetical protein KBS64_06995 [Treponema sp.]|nr:hypothetical protein [Candidatus Treponema equi]
MASCSLNQDPAGSVSITLPAEKNATRGLSDSGIKFFEINLAGPTPGTLEAGPGETIFFDSLVFGIYSLSIDGYGIDDASGESIKLCEGKKENIDVKSGDPTEVTITLYPVKQTVPEDNNSGEKDEIITDDEEKTDDVIVDDDNNKKDDVIVDTDDNKDDKTEEIQTPEDGDKDDQGDDVEPKYDYDSPEYIGLRKVDANVMEDNGELCYITGTQTDSYENLFRVVRDGVEQTISSVEISEGNWSGLGPATAKITTANDEEFSHEFLIKKVMKPTTLTITTRELSDEIPEITVTFGLLQTEDTINNPTDGISQINSKDCSEIVVSYVLTDPETGETMAKGDITGIKASEEKFSLTKENLSFDIPGEYTIYLSLRQVPKTEYRMYYIEGSFPAEGNIIIR